MLFLKVSSTARCTAFGLSRIKVISSRDLVTTLILYVFDSKRVKMIMLQSHESSITWVSLTFTLKVRRFSAESRPTLAIDSTVGVDLTIFVDPALVSAPGLGVGVLGKGLPVDAFNDGFIPLVAVACGFRPLEVEPAPNFYPGAASCGRCVSKGDAVGASRRGRAAIGVNPDGISDN